ncbi:MAG: cyclopropane-fatty-acyl-phospholipid synthase family protein [Candidatus Eisenbacteria bacterium]|nr:cyclopropane-fatty-acyl-phospholipid synthase family protein [Candidatus Eisenbacteria bacterium]
MNESQSDQLTAAGRLPFSASRSGIINRLSRSAVLNRFTEWREGRLEVRLPEGERLMFGQMDADPVIRTHVVRDDAFRRLLFAGEIGIGESYMAGDWWADDLPRCLRMFLRNQPPARLNAGMAGLAGLWNAFLHQLRANTRAGSRLNIRAHYDVGNDFYRLFLDDSMTYSSGVFPSGRESLEEAQRIKSGRIVAALGLSPGHHLLDIGCGWGSLAITASLQTGCRVTGITLSREQLELARARVAEAGLTGRVEIRLMDYRDVRESFDRVVSIEMFEAVGYENYDGYFAAIDRALKPGGRAFLQTITVPDEGFHTYRFRSDFIRRHVFPGSLLASVAEIGKSLRRASRLDVIGREEIGLHYVPTLQAWRRRFLDRLATVRALGHDERFIRMWDYYLASCEAAFHEKVIGNVQLLLARPGEDGRSDGLPVRRTGGSQDS